ncbi:MAG: MOSC domain-containing protein [Chloroflexota bacterium]|nr:MOSC domain-containing protein [Chloroflexota bacterium]
MASSTPSGPRAGRVEAIHIAPERALPMVLVSSVAALAGRGLDGDRYARKAGTYSRGRLQAGRELTLIAAEALDAMAAESGVSLSPAESRRNVLTRGITLEELVGKRFRIGPVLCFGEARCPPCGHLERLTRPGIVEALGDRGGLRADILESGTIRVGDEVRLAADR